MAMSAHARSFDVEAAVESTASSRGLVSHKPFVEKCTQLYNIAQVGSGRAL